MKNETNNNSWLITGIIMLVLISLAIVLYGDTVAYLNSVWKQWELGDYGHGYLVLLISGYLIYRKRADLTSRPPCPSLIALLPLAIAALGWLLATLTDIQTLQSVALVSLLIALVWSLSGGRATTTILFPLMFLFLALPVWTVISPVLQAVTADAVFFLTRLIDIPALRVENFIVLPAGQLAIEEACSGLRFVLAATTLGALFAYLNYSSLVSRVVIMVLAIAGAVIMNIVRVLIVVILAYQTDMQHPMVSDHLTLGWYLFAGLVAMLLILEFLAFRAGWVTHQRDDVNQVAEKQAGTDRCANGSAQLSVVAFVAALLVISSSLILDYYRAGDTSLEPVSTIEFPRATGGWQGPTRMLNGWFPVFRGAYAEKHKYMLGNQVVYLYMALYRGQSQGAELINDRNSISGAGEWMTVAVGQRPVESAGIKLRWQLLQSKSGEQRLVYYWYNVAGLEATDSYMAKLLQLYGLFTGDNGAAAVVLGTNVKANDSVGAHGVLNDFLSLHRESIRHHLSAMD